eukprot:jgi/Psemu1/34533/gm1.34533_g
MSIYKLLPQTIILKQPEQKILMEHHQQRRDINPHLHQRLDFQLFPKNQGTYYQGDKIPVKTVTSDGETKSNTLLPHDDDGKPLQDKGDKSDEENMDKMEMEVLTTKMQTEKTTFPLKVGQGYATRNIKVMLKDPDLEIIYPTYQIGDPVYAVIRLMADWSMFSMFPNNTKVMRHTLVTIFLPGDDGNAVIQDYADGNTNTSTLPPKVRRRTRQYKKHVHLPKYSGEPVPTKTATDPGKDNWIRLSACVEPNVAAQQPLVERKFWRNQLQGWCLESSNYNINTLTTKLTTNLQGQKLMSVDTFFRLNSRKGRFEEEEASSTSTVMTPLASDEQKRTCNNEGNWNRMDMYSLQWNGVECFHETIEETVKEEDTKLKQLKNKEKNEEEDGNKGNIQHWLLHLYQKCWNSPEDFEEYNKIPVPRGSWGRVK